jgi:hypothetical protein
MTGQNTWRARPGQPDHDPRLRASDRDREAIAESLRIQHGQGRLDTEELQDLIDRCYDAKTLGELDALVADLPRESQPDAPRRDHRVPWRPRVSALAPIVVGLAAISALTGRPVIWLAVPLFFLTARLTAARHPPPWSSRLHHPGAGRCSGPPTESAS